MNSSYGILTEYWMFHDLPKILQLNIPKILRTEKFFQLTYSWPVLEMTPPASYWYPSWWAPFSSLPQPASCFAPQAVNLWWNADGIRELSWTLPPELFVVLYWKCGRPILSALPVAWPLFLLLQIWGYFSPSKFTWILIVPFDLPRLYLSCLFWLTIFPFSSGQPLLEVCNIV